MCIRKRPLFPKEINKNEFDAITVHEPHHATVHDARMRPDMKHMFMTHNEYTFDRVFDERADNDAVYKHTVAPLVQHAVRGGTCTCFMFGQTGSGKTFTTAALQERMARDLFHMVKKSKVSLVGVSVFEMAGAACTDLLSDGAKLQLLEAGNGDVVVQGLCEIEVTRDKELMEIIHLAQQKRATSATGVHDASSRSHAIYRVQLHQVRPGE